MFEEVPFAKKKAPLRVSPERKEWVRRESMLLLSRNLVQREKVKTMAEREQMEFELRQRTLREDRLKRWRDRTAASPFAMDLVAESDRITIEAQLRESEAQKLRDEFVKRREQAKNEIVLKALAEFSDLEALRREKRAIMEEEQRLRALLALEMSNGGGNSKEDRLQARRAERQRKEAKAAHRRMAYQSSLEEVLREEAEALRRKHGLPNSSSMMSTSSLNSTGASPAAAGAGTSTGGMGYGFGPSTAGSSASAGGGGRGGRDSPDFDRMGSAYGSMQRK